MTSLILYVNKDVMHVALSVCKKHKISLGKIIFRFGITVRTIVCMCGYSRGILRSMRRWQKPTYNLFPVKFREITLFVLMILYSSALNLIEGGVISHIQPAVNISLTTSILCSDTVPQTLWFISEITASFTFQIAVASYRKNYQICCSFI
jgi:hypothetical protein